MNNFKPFQASFQGGISAENTENANSFGSFNSCSSGAQAGSPDPTPATIKIGGGVGRPSPCGGEEDSEVLKVVLTERDKRILALCYEQQFLLKEHIENYFKGCSSRRINFRIKQLIVGGFLKRENYPELPFHHILRLTPKGRKQARQCEVKTQGQVTRLNSSTLYHDALVTSCRLRIADIWDAEFLPERSLKEWGTPEIPDGLWRFKSGKQIVLEVECSDKGRSRFLNRLSELSRVDAITFVLYVTSSDRMFAIVQSYLKNNTAEQPAGVVKWEDLKTGTPPVITQQGEIDLFARKDF